MALATAKLFVEEGAYVFITGRRQEQLDKAIKEIGKIARERGVLFHAMRVKAMRMSRADPIGSPLA